jgi:hypothetical protein
VRVELPLHLDQGSGLTRDISQDGVFFYTDQTLTPGMPLRFALELRHIAHDETFYLHCLGQVVRVEKIGKKMGIAATIKEYTTAA